ncbi:Cof-type HAD-IIB family hydrolase [Lacticigenium naphthae]|uniref:Cof-type HAD-IIB family hydrolase n=1 Tax=Lacticigenium naphthae TaxID=515351 RepID=UPI000424CCED|nr:Cof-type HAD-IIB family hydrolase [Lacticigenium naphthae]
MKAKSLVFFDLDGTLLNKQSKVDPAVKEALAMMKDNGHVPFIATGRSMIEIQHVLDETVIDSFITLNGQYIQFEGKEVYRSVIPIDIIERVIRMTEEKKVALSFYSEDKIRITHHNQNIVDTYAYLHENPPAVDPKLYTKEEILMLLVVTKNTALDADFRNAFPELSFYRNTPHSIDTISKGNSKATAIDSLIKSTNLFDIPVYAFGDGPNDIEMIKRADYGVAMGNGISEIKEAAQFITSDHSNGGVIEGLKQLNLI